MSARATTLVTIAGATVTATAGTKPIGMASTATVIVGKPRPIKRLAKPAPKDVASTTAVTFGPGHAHTS